jgi:hypothetical protein
MCKITCEKTACAKTRMFAKSHVQRHMWKKSHVQHHTCSQIRYKIVLVAYAWLAGTDMQGLNRMSVVFRQKKSFGSGLSRNRSLFKAGLPDGMFSNQKSKFG